jgi:hypothetical protein
MSETNAPTSEPGRREEAESRRLTRRDVVRCLGCAGVGVATAGSTWSGVATTAAQDLGLVATPEAASRQGAGLVGDSQAVEPGHAEARVPRAGNEVAPELTTKSIWPWSFASGLLRCLH